MLDKNRERWLSLWKRIGALGNGEEELADLVRRYSESQRAYHTLVHIDHCLDELTVTRHYAMRPDAIALALWYHDAIYKTHAVDNEEKSAELATRILKQALAPPLYVAEVVTMILATKHTAVFDNPDVQLLIDIDLAILGQPEPIFDEYESNIRKEYEWVPRDVFTEKRACILRSFLERPQIYSTTIMRCQYEVLARKNIVRSLSQLSSS